MFLFKYSFIYDEALRALKEKKKKRKFSKKRLLAILKEKFKDYKEAWGIVQKEGYQNIIREFVERIK